MVLRGKHRLWKPLVASTVAAATLTTGIGFAVADGTSDGTYTKNDGGTITSAVIRWAYKDDASGSWGSSSDSNSVVRAIQSVGTPVTNDGAGYNGFSMINDVLASANAKCVDQFHRNHPNEGDGDCRVVGVGFVRTATTNHFNGGTKWESSDFKKAWYATVASQQFNYAGQYRYYTSTPFHDNPSKNVNSLMESATSNQYTTLAVIVLDKYEPAPPEYKLTVTTEAHAPSDLRVGSTDPVFDTLNVSNDGDQDEHLGDATVYLKYDGQPNGYVAAKSAAKTVDIRSTGKFTSPQFTPADLGMEHWQEGNYWFDVTVPKVGHMANPVDTNDREASESWQMKYETPPTPEKRVEKDVSADSMTNTTTITTGTGRGTYEMLIKDTIDPNGMKYDVSNMKVMDTTANTDISNEFTITWDKNANTVTAVRAADKGEMPLEHTITFTLDVTVHHPENSTIKDTALVKPNQTPEVSTDTRSVSTWKPQPNKSWIRKNPATGKWESVVDPDWTNTTGVDTQTVLDGDVIGSVVNGTVRAHLIDTPFELTLTDDYANADYLFDGDAKNLHVYEIENADSVKPSTADIVNAGTDVSKYFNFSMQGTKVTATAKPEYLKKLKGMDHTLQVTLLVAGKANYANGGGAAQVRKDYGKQEGEEVSFCTAAGSDRKFTNSGSETINEQTLPTNEPNICGYVPHVKKDVVSEASQGGDQESVDGKVVYPGQKVEYQLTTEPQLPKSLAYTIESVEFVDTYSEFLRVDKQTLEITDLNTAKTISKKLYKTQWDDAAHAVRVVLDPSVVAKQWMNGGNPRLLVRFEGTVDANAPTDTKVNNDWVLKLNNSLTPSNTVTNIPPAFTPDKRVTQSAQQGDPSVQIDGKTFLVGDTGEYRLTLDLHQKDTAYKVYRAGMVDDYDERYLTVNADTVRVLDGTSDVTAKFNVAVKSGVLYVFAKTVDTMIDTTGEVAKGDPQPADLAAYAVSKSYDPLHDPAIDQSLLGKKYTIVLPFVVSDTTQELVKNTATQVTNDVRKDTNMVTNRIVSITPHKDVTVKVGGESANGASIYLHNTFLYQLDSSILPANRAYEQVKHWSISDTFDPQFDRVTGAWAVYASRDLYKDGKLLAHKGDVIGGYGADTNALGSLFTMSRDGNTMTVAATDAYLALVSADNAHESGFRVYVQVERMKVTDRHENVFTETLNDTPRKSNIVWTRTPDLTPSISLEKWDEASGRDKGDRDDPAQALEGAKDGDVIVFTITNTSKTDKNGYGAWFKASDLQLSDQTIVGDGTVVDLKYPDHWDTLVLKPGESVDVKGVLRGFTQDKHTDRAQVTGKPLVECPVTDNNGLPTDPAHSDGTASAANDADGVSEYMASGEHKTVTVDGRTLCEDTVVSSNTDDWNGKVAPKLAQTGAATGVLMGVMLALVAAGGILFVQRRKTMHDATVSTGKHAA